MIFNFACVASFVVQIENARHVARCPRRAAGNGRRAACAPRCFAAPVCLRRKNRDFATRSQRASKRSRCGRQASSPVMADGPLACHNSRGRLFAMTAGTAVFRSVSDFLDAI